MPNLKKDIDLIKKFPEIISAIQFGSTVSGDTYKGSDVDLLIVTKDGCKEETGKRLRRELSYDYQTHIYDKKEFLGVVSKKEPIVLSAVHTGKILLDNNLIKNIEDGKPNKFTIEKSMLNSFAALGLGISDLMHGMLWDSVNSFYHATRSSIWATLMEKEVTPNNKRIFELLKDQKTKERYKEMINFRSDIPDYEADFDFDKKMWKNGNFNEFTDLLNKACLIIKKNYWKLFGRKFVDLFKLLEILKDRYKLPNHYSVMLSVDWDKMLPFYYVMLSFEDKYIWLEINAHTGKIKEERSKKRR